MKFKNSLRSTISLSIIILIISISIYFLLNSKTNKPEELQKNQIIESLEYISNQNNEEENFYKSAKLLNSIDLSETEFENEKAFYSKLDFYKVHSENYGKFILYNGKHCKLLLSKFPLSEYIDDCFFILHLIDNEKKDALNLKNELIYLKNFLVKFPNTNLKSEILEKIKNIQEEIQSGSDFID